MKGPNGERLGDYLEGEHPEERDHSPHLDPTLVVIEDGLRRSGSALRAGDFIERTDYDHGRRVLEVHTSPAKPLPLRLRLRRWWEGRRGHNS